MKSFKKTIAVLLALLMLVPFGAGMSALTVNNDSAEKLWYVNADYGDSALISESDFQFGTDSCVPTISELLSSGLAQKQTVSDGITMYKITDTAAFMAKYYGDVVAGGAEKLTINAEDYLNELVRVMVIFDEEALFDNSELNLGVGKKTDSNLYHKYSEAAKKVQDKHIDTISGISSDVGFVARGVLLANYATFEMPRRLIRKVNSLSGVKKAFIEPEFAVAPYENISDGEHDGDSTGALQVGLEGAWRKGFTGEGMAISVIDTGCQYTHQGFNVLPEEATAHFNAQQIDDLLRSADFVATERMNGGLDADMVYINSKFPFCFDYSQNDTDVLHHGVNSHGTMVSGVVAANTTAEDTPFICYDKVGVAPDAQLVIMKVFDGDTASMTNILAAMEDSVLLGVDAVNLSLGHACGFDTEYDWNEIFDRASAAGISVVASAGNDANSMTGVTDNGYPYTSNPDNGTLGGPGTYSSVFTVGSLNSSSAPRPGNKLGIRNEKLIDHEEIIELWIDADYGTNPNFFSKVFNGAVVPFEIVWNNDVSAYDLSGKIAFMFEDASGTLTTQEVYELAAQAGAAGVVLVPYDEDSDCLIDSDVSADSIPCVATYYWDFFELMWWAFETYGIEHDEYQLDTPVWIAETANAGEMSDFSSWGPTPNLKLKPEILGIGGNVYTLYGHNTSNSVYVWTSGTSFSAPQVAAGAALVRQYVRELYPDASEKTVEELAYKLLMSTASAVANPNTGYCYSPRQQGSGLMNLTAATGATAYLEVNGMRPKIELGDDPGKTGEYVLNFSIVNIGNEAKTYTVDTAVYTEQAESLSFSGGKYLYAMTGEEHELNPSVDGMAEVTVPAGETVDVSVTIRLSASDKRYIERYYEYGSYVEGYVFLTQQDSAEQSILSLPFLTFYGDWTKIPVFEDVYYYNYLENLENNPSTMGMMGAYTTENGNLVGLGDIAFGIEETVHVLPVGESYNKSYDEIRNYISPNGDGIRDGLEYVVLPLMRNVEKLTYTITDNKTGEIYYTDYAEYLTKSMNGVPHGIHDTENETSFWFMPWYGTDADGNALPDNTSVTVSIVAEKYYNGELITDNDHAEWHFNLTIDLTPPQLLEFGVDDYPTNSVFFRYVDNGIASFNHMNSIYGGPTASNPTSNKYFFTSVEYPLYGKTPGKESTCGFGQGNTYLNYFPYLCVTIRDYAGNTSIWAFSDESNNPYDPGNGENLVDLDCGDEVFLRVGETLNISNLVDITDYGIDADPLHDFEWNSSESRVVSIDSTDRDSAVISGVSEGDATVTLQLRGLPARGSVNVHVVADIYRISKSVTGSGVIEGADIVESLTDATYSIIPDEGFMISDVIVDGVSVGAVSSYTFEHVTAGHSIAAVFERIPAAIYTVTFVDCDGTILSVQNVEAGSSATAPTVPEREHYAFTGWSCDFSHVNSNLIVVAQYELDIVIGDVNFDGSIDMTDALITMRISLGITESFEAQLAAADVDGSYNVSTEDALILLRFSLGIAALPRS